MPLSAEEILAIKTPERLFRDQRKIKEIRRDLAQVWHPDHNKDLRASAVFAHINKLYDDAVRHIKDGIWNIPGLLELEGIDGKKRRIKYKMHHTFELGDVYYGDTVVAYVLATDFADLFENGRKIIANFKFRDVKMKAEMEKFLPSIKSTFETKNNLFVMVVGKPADAYRADDVQSSLGGKRPFLGRLRRR